MKRAQSRAGCLKKSSEEVADAALLLAKAKPARHCSFARRRRCSVVARLHTMNPRAAADLGSDHRKWGNNQQRTRDTYHVVKPHAYRLDSE